MKRLSIRLDNDIEEKISEILSVTGKKRSEVIRRLLELGLQHWGLKQQYGTPQPFGKGTLMGAERTAIQAAAQSLFILRKMVTKEVADTAKAEAKALLAARWNYEE